MIQPVFSTLPLNRKFMYNMEENLPLIYQSSHDWGIIKTFCTQMPNVGYRISDPELKTIVENKLVSSNWFSTINRRKKGKHKVESI